MAINVLVVARVAHEINRIYCKSLGEDAQPAWEDAPQWQRDSAADGVQFHLTHPKAGPAASHDNWMRRKIADGWTHGEIKDPEAKTHPCLVPFTHLPPEQQFKDVLFRVVVHAAYGMPL